MGDRSITSHSEQYEADSSYTEEDRDHFGDDEPISEDYTENRLRRDSSYEVQGGGDKENAVQILMRLAETLGAEEGIDYSVEDSSESQRLKKQDSDYYPYDDNLDTYNSYPKKGFKRRPSRVVADEDEYDEEEEDKTLQYKTMPFNADPENLNPDYDPENPFPLPSEVSKGDSNFKHYNKKTKINWIGSLIVFLYCCAFGFYMYIRVSKTMDLGKYIGYGAFVLGVEIIGAITTMLYGVNLILLPVYDEIPKENENSTLPLMQNSYHIRVLIPCYKESLELIQRVVTAALDAQLPSNCYRTVYLCDDGKDGLKRRWCQRMGPSIQYVSGRNRSPKEMNGKSGNLNNCLEQIYPDGVVIPHTELVCIFDADQLANSDFFCKTVPLFDLGDDVGMVLSPQAFHNLRLHADVFNHANIHFWEYAQPGYDALGFISCTGTNFLTRSTALKESGWSPTYTLTEDFALGMTMKANKWQCCYVEEYLAIGEAPEQIRNCFQQRSRWCKGHFQVVLSRKYCPLLQRKLPIGQRILYCSGVWSYIVGALTTPTFMIIPILTIWAGIFPIVVSNWAALALTVYFLAQTTVLSYSKKVAHVESLWFAGIANNILWFTFVKACFRSITSLFGNTITFKTTLKGVNRLQDSAFGDLWMPVLSFIVMAVSLGYGIRSLAQGTTIITTLTISVVWIVYGMIPPYLLLHYTIIGRGSTLQFMSRIMFVLSYACGICALVLLWAVYPKEYDMNLSTDYSLRFFEAQRVGHLPANNRIPWRSDALTYESSSVLGLDLTGGWMYGGEAGTLKLTMPSAYAVTMLAWGLLAFQSGYDKSGQTQYARDEIKWGTDYLLKTISKNGSDYNIVYQVGNLTSDSTFWGAPEAMTQENNPRPVFYFNTTAGASDLCGQMVGAFASAAIVESKFATDGNNGTYYTQLMDQANTLYQQATLHQGRFTSTFEYDCVSPFAKSMIGRNATYASLCVNRYDYQGGNALAVFNSSTYYDDLMWAASWMYYATGNNSYLSDAQTFASMHLNQERDADSDLVVDYDRVYWPSNFLLAKLTGVGAYHQRIKSFLKQWVCGTNGQIRFTPKGRAWNGNAGNTGVTQTVGFLSLLYGEQAGSEITDSQRTRYVCFTRTQARYLLGDVGRSLITGFGKNPPTHVQNRAASCKDVDDCSISNAWNTTEANPNILYGAIPQFMYYTDKYKDLRTDNDSRVDIGNNVAFSGVSAGLIDAPGTWSSCLQGFGVLTKDKAVCDNDDIL